MNKYKNHQLFKKFFSKNAFIFSTVSPAYIRWQLCL